MLQSTVTVSMMMANVRVMFKTFYLTHNSIYRTTATPYPRRELFLLTTVCVFWQYCQTWHLFHRKYKLRPSQCTTKFNVLMNRLALRPQLMLFLCKKHLFDYTDGFTPDGFQLRGTRRDPICMQCHQNVAERRITQTTLHAFTQTWQRPVLIGTVLCRKCHGDVVNPAILQERQLLPDHDAHSHPASQPVVDDVGDMVTFTYSQPSVTSSARSYKNDVCFSIFCCFKSQHWQIEMW